VSGRRFDIKNVKKSAEEIAPEFITIPLSLNPSNEKSLKFAGAVS
jgi:hypothetical protein